MECDYFSRRRFLSCLAGSAAFLSTSGCLRQKRTNKPNIIFILADDLGFGDLGCYGSRAIQTPHLDDLAASGMRFTQFYAASAVCTPTRASCLTGRYPLRFNITGHFRTNLLEYRDEHLPLKAVTLPKLLKKAGYATAHVGKWHLGGLSKEHLNNRAKGVPGPHQHGFDHFLCMYEDQNRQDLLQKRRMYRDGGRFLVRNDQPLPSIGRHWTDYKIDESLLLIEKFHKEGRPFFLNLWYDAPHTPYEPAPDPYLNRYKSRAKGDDLLYRSMVTHLDAGVGRIRAKLNELGIEKDTLIIFTSDNGPSFEGSPGSWKGGKADLHEGGIREPMIAFWPGKIPKGVVSDELVHTNDLLPTFCAAVDHQLPQDLQVDGLNILPHLIDEKPLGERGTLFWQLDLYKWYPQPGDKPLPYATEVARRGPWKLLASNGRPVELFHLEDDPYERRNLLDVWLDVAKELATELQAWLKEPRMSWRNYKSLND